jgi:hypothetical protein
MKVKSCIVVLAAAFAVRAFAEPEPFRFSLDTTGEPALVTSSSRAVQLWCRAGDSVFAVEKFSLAAATPVAGAQSTGMQSWTPAAGGVWHLEHPREGSAEVRVRYSIFSEQEGFESSPAKFVDADELAQEAQIAAAGGNLAGYYFFAFERQLQDLLPVFPGYRVEDVGGGVYRFVSAADGEVYRSGASVFTVDSVKPGPGRRVRIDETPAVAYSGDNWMGAESAASTLTVTSPSGVSESRDFSGTGAKTLPKFSEAGKWTLKLESASGVMMSELNVVEPPVAIIIR